MALLYKLNVHYVPAKRLSGQGSDFESEVIQELYKFLAFKRSERLFTTPNATEFPKGSIELC